MSQFRLTAVGPEPRTWDGPHGRLYIWSVEAEGDQDSGSFEIKTKKDEPPAVGSTIDAEIKRRPGFPSELKRIYQDKPSQGKSPAESNRISRMNAQAQALKLIELEIQTGKMIESLSWSEVVKRIDAFYLDSKKAGEE